MTASRTPYRKPDWFSRRLLNPTVVTLTRLGIGVGGSRLLRVRGRSSGVWRETPVNLLKQDDGLYLVAPRGETQWVRNLRAAGGGELRLGRRRQPFTAQEITGDARATVVRGYLKRWGWETGVFFRGVRADAPEAELAAEAQHHPVFRVQLSGS